MNVKKITYEMFFENQDTTPIVLRIGILIPKDYAGTSVNIGNDEFFRNWGTLDHVDFGTPLKGLDITGRPINTDKYDILFQKRVLLGPKNAAVNALYNVPAKSEFHWKYTLPVNRQFKFDAGGFTQGNDPTLVYWLDSRTTAANAVAVGAIAKVIRNIRVHFQENQ